MPFSDQDKERLLAAKFVGPTVVKRLEEAGFDDFSKLKSMSVDQIVEHIAAQLGASCWKNSHQSRQAISNVIEVAKSG